MRHKPDLELNKFFKNSKPVKFKKGEVLLRAWEPFFNVYYIIKGYVKVYSVSESGEELILIIYKPGDFFPTSAIQMKKIHKYFIETMTPAEMIKLPRDKFLKFILENKQAHFELTRRILDRFSGVLQRMEYMVYGTAAAKVASILLICAERFGTQVGRGVLIGVPLTHMDIASLIGVTRETASIEMKKLENEGVIERRMKLIFIKKIDYLKKKFFLK